MWELLNINIYNNRFAKTHKEKKRIASVKELYASEYYRIIKDSLYPIDSKVILDLGCGEGFWLSKFAEAGGFCFGLDISLMGLKKIVGKGFRNAVCSNFVSLPFKENQFDIVFSNHSIEHTLQKARVLSEIRRVLRSGGLLFIATPNIYSLPEIFLLRKEINRLKAGHAEILSPQKLKNLLEKSGFRILKYTTSGIFYPGGMPIPLLGRYLSLAPIVYFLSIFDKKLPSFLIRLERFIANTFFKQIGHDIIFLCENIK